MTKPFDPTGCPYIVKLATGDEVIEHICFGPFGTYDLAKAFAAKHYPARAVGYAIDCMFPPEDADSLKRGGT